MVESSLRLLCGLLEFGAVGEKKFSCPVAVRLYALIENLYFCRYILVALNYERHKYYFSLSSANRLEDL